MGFLRVLPIQCRNGLRLAQDLHFRRPFSTGTNEPGLFQSFFDGSPWDMKNRVRVAASAVGVLGAIAFTFDTVYRRVTKQELKELKQELKQDLKDLEMRVDKKIDHIESRIDQLGMGISGLSAQINGLALALLNTQSRERVALQEENERLKREKSASTPQ
jgi:DNA anti-recombination protein RmuC